MKIKQLIEKLQQEDPEKLVLLNDGKGFISPRVIGPPTLWLKAEYLDTELNKREQNAIVIGAY